ncbi:unnamed protein product [Sphenostylis stenocarpa]|uniref:Uncharacterized protein n=1 Tax=Sphenostylis stenocarpa TaxID=92480 RepID=A0AA86VVF4_9FABA|nr:unnamed protein product [Sphenostylis stenocarpa]
MPRSSISFILPFCPSFQLLKMKAPISLSNNVSANTFEIRRSEGIQPLETRELLPNTRPRFEVGFSGFETFPVEDLGKAEEQSYHMEEIHRGYTFIFKRGTDKEASGRNFIEVTYMFLSPNPAIQIRSIRQLRLHTCTWEFKIG